MKMVKLHGDASYRTYFREIDDKGQTRIIMQLPEGKSSASEEITNLNSTPQEPPFLNIARYLRNHRIPVPEVLGYDPVKRQIFLEDLGDDTVEKRVRELSLEKKAGLYRNAIDLLIDFQALTQTPDKECIAFQRSFDQTLYQWEFDHFVEYGIESRSGVKVVAQDRQGITVKTREISRVLSDLPYVLTHRDFQSRNLMLQGETLRLIDFQDALLAPPQYDLVALLRDSYIELEWSLVEDLINYYLDRIQGKIEATQDRGQFKKMFDWLTIQRKLKDAGRFVYIDRVKKNPSFLKHIPTSLAYVRQALERQPELSPLFNVLRKYVPEFQAI
ncbi:MAG: phosphotransferase [Deltaproteobacteria bacterium]|nr:phosphotransferase [Deltaproteobacteria bacterium]